MAEDWKPGDDALCVRTFPGYDILHPKPPEVGKQYRVLRVMPLEEDMTWPDGTRGISIEVSGVRSCNHDNSFSPLRFIKVTPQAPDAFDEEVIWHMTCDPVPAGA